MERNKYVGLCIGGPYDGRIMSESSNCFKVILYKPPPDPNTSVLESDYVENIDDVVTYVFIESRRGESKWMPFSDWEDLPRQEQLRIGRLAL